jgi:hypothetical protein
MDARAVQKLCVIHSNGAQAVVKRVYREKPLDVCGLPNSRCQI